MTKGKVVNEIKFAQPGPELTEIPKQPEFYKLPVRFGSVPVDEAPLGWEVATRERQTKVTRFQHAYPTIRLPFQEVQRIEFGHKEEFLRRDAKIPKLAELFPAGANRLFFGDCLHVMRQLPSGSIDLIYVDPPFFSGRNYNVIFGDKNEVQSFSDIWEGGMPGYLIWLNARLYEMKRLLKSRGSLFVHLDWHASHYVKVEMDKVFGFEGFRNEISWYYANKLPTGGRLFDRHHDTILWYTRTDQWKFNEIRVEAEYKGTQLVTKKVGGVRLPVVDEKTGKQVRVPSKDKPCGDVWRINMIHPQSEERIGYPTQKPEELMERIITAASDVGDVVADFFCGGGTTPVVAQRLNRRWVACDQSRIAVAISADRMTRVVEEKIGKIFPVPDFTVEHWGIYEIPRLERYSPDLFREFVVRAFGGKPDKVSPHIHGVRHGIPLYVGEPRRTTRIARDDVTTFAEAIFKERRSNFGTMLAWNFGPDAKRAAEILAARENKRIDFVRLALVRLESEEFPEHARSLHKNYGELLSFVQPPEVRINVNRKGLLRYTFDVSESVSLNKDGVLANVQWDFDYQDRFSTSPGYTFLRDKKTGRAQLVAEYEFPVTGKRTIACSVQDDQGGEKTVIMEIDAR